MFGGGALEANLPARQPACCAAGRQARWQLSILLIHYARQQGWEVRWVNPVYTYRMKEIHGNTPDKNDAKDTYVISELMSMGKALHYNKRDTLAEGLQSLHRHRHQLTKQLAQLCNRAEGILAGVWLLPWAA